MDLKLVDPVWLIGSYPKNLSVWSIKLQDKGNKSFIQLVEIPIK